MKRNPGTLLMVLGLCLLAGAAGLLVHNNREARQADQASRAMLQQLEAYRMETTQAPQPQQMPQMPVREPAEPEPVLTLPEEEPDPEMETVELDGRTYVGEIQIPDLNLALPVLSDWSYENLRLAPCRYHGNLATEDLVIMAHNYKPHFGRVLSLEPGAEVRFRDVNQQVTRFQVIGIETLQPDQVEEMNAGEYPLTLFTCAFGGQTRVALRCDEITEQSIRSTGGGT